MTDRLVKAGVIGCGKISAIYLHNAKRFENFDVVAVADLRLGAAQSRAREYQIPRACSIEELLADPEIEIVLNLTPHRIHGQVGLSVLDAGKCPYNEKPLAVDRGEGLQMLEVAAARGLRVGAAPDTFFGGAWQTARQLMDAGGMGRPIGALACLMAYKSPLAAPPRPDEDGYINLYGTDFFEFGVTWSFDRGPYYLHALIHLLGPVQRVTGSAQNPWKEHPQAKEKVRTPTHFAAVLDFTNGVVATLFLTSEVHPTHLPHIEIYGTEGSLRCTDPNNFGGSLFLRKPEEEEMVPVECAFGYDENSRGVGVADLASALRSGRPHRANREMGYHVIDIVHALHEASEQERHVVLESTCDQPTPLPQGLADWEID